MVLSSPNVSVSLTESALMMPSRKRSWIKRSSVQAPDPAETVSGLLFSCFAAALALATVLPRDQKAKDHMETAESERHQRNRPTVAGAKAATVPTTRNETPMIGTIRTENAPPDDTPAPYNNNHTAGKRWLPLAR